MKLRPKTQAAFDNILDTMNGADGCGRFVRLLAMVRAMDKLAAEGDENGKQILDVMLRFSKLIDVANEKKKPEKAERLPV